MSSNPNTELHTSPTISPRDIVGDIVGDITLTRARTYSWEGEAMKDGVRTSRAGNSRAGNSRAGNSRASNWRCPYGELDVVAAQDGEIVYVEATTRRGTELGAPEAAIAAGKWA